MTEALAELVRQIAHTSEEADQLGRLLRAVELDPVSAVTSATNLRQVSQILAMADRILTLERLKIEGLSLVALHRSESGGSA